MRIRLRCPECGSQLEDVNPILIGKEVSCRQCGHRFVAEHFVTDKEREAEWWRRRYAQGQTQQEEQKGNLDTHMGGCPQCGSRNVRQYHIDETNWEGVNVGAGAASCCCGGCLLYPLFYPLFLLLSYLGNRQIGMGRACNVCGHKWRV